MTKFDEFGLPEPTKYPQMPKVIKMNERILKLAEQAKAESSQWLGSKPATTITYDELEKFAELIVKECSYLADQAHHKATGGKSAGGYIRQHFGVEE